MAMDVTALAYCVIGCMYGPAGARFPEPGIKPAKTLADKFRGRKATWRELQEEARINLSSFVAK